MLRILSWIQDPAASWEPRVNTAVSLSMLPFALLQWPLLATHPCCRLQEHHCTYDLCHEAVCVLQRMGDVVYVQADPIICLNTKYTATLDHWLKYLWVNHMYAHWLKHTCGWLLVLQPVIEQPCIYAFKADVMTQCWCTGENDLTTSCPFFGWLLNTPCLRRLIANFSSKSKAQGIVYCLTSKSKA